MGSENAAAIWRNAGSSCFRRLFQCSYSPEASSKSCSTCTASCMINICCEGKMSRTYLEEILLVTEGLFLLLPQLVQRVVVSIIVDQLHTHQPCTSKPPKNSRRRTLWSRFVIVFLIRLQISCSSRLGVITLESINSNSGANVSRSSSISVWYCPILFTVTSACG